MEKTFKLTELTEGVIYYSNNTDTKYMVEDGLIYYQDNETGKWSLSSDQYNYLVTYDFIIAPYEPEEGQTYFFPTFYTEMKWDSYRWTGHHVDTIIKNVTGVYRTREEALEKARKLGWL